MNLPDTTTRTLPKLKGKLFLKGEVMLQPRYSCLQTVTGQFAWAVCMGSLHRQLANGWAISNTGPVRDYINPPVDHCILLLLSLALDSSYIGY
jgi:hypothetical protein